MPAGRDRRRGPQPRRGAVVGRARRLAGGEGGGVDAHQVAAGVEREVVRGADRGVLVHREVGLVELGDEGVVDALSDVLVELLGEEAEVGAQAVEAGRDIDVDLERHEIVDLAAVAARPAAVVLARAGAVVRVVREQGVAGAEDRVARAARREARERGVRDRGRVRVLGEREALRALVHVGARLAAGVRVVDAVVAVVILAVGARRGGALRQLAVVLLGGAAVVRWVVDLLVAVVVVAVGALRRPVVLFEVVGPRRSRSRGHRRRRRGRRRRRPGRWRTRRRARS